MKNLCIFGDYIFSMEIHSFSGRNKYFESIYVCVVCGKRGREKCTNPTKYSFPLNRM